MPQTNEQFITTTFEKLGFHDFFNDAFQAGRQAKLPEIEFQPGKLDMNGAALIILPKVVEEKKHGDGFYVMKGFMATRQEEGKQDVSQFFPVYKTIGFNLDQADRLLTGAAVRHLVGYENDKPKFAYSQINFNERTENENFKMIKRPDDGSMIKNLGLLGIIGNQAEKEQIYARIQAGERVAVNVRVGDGSRRVNIQAAVRKTGLGIDLSDMNGTLLKQYPEINVRRLQPLQTAPSVTKIPEGTVKTVTTPPPPKPDKKNKHLK